MNRDRRDKLKRSRLRRMIKLLSPADCSRFVPLLACMMNMRANLKALIPPDWHRHLTRCRDGITYRPCMQCCRSSLACKPHNPCCPSCTHRLTWGSIEIKLDGQPFTGFTMAEFPAFEYVEVAADDPRLALT